MIRSLLHQVHVHGSLSSLSKVLSFHSMLKKNMLFSMQLRSACVAELWTADAVGLARLRGFLGLNFLYSEYVLDTILRRTHVQGAT